MRRLGSDKKSEANKKRNVTAGIVLLAIMVLSTLGYAFSLSSRNTSGDGSTTPGGTDSPPVNVGNNWIVTIHGQQFFVAYPPEQTQNVTIESTKSLNSYFDQPLYIDSKNNSVVFSEISSNLGRFAYRVQGACYEECEENLPLKDCSTNLIVWTNSTENKVTQQDNCIFINGDLRTVDAFLFKVLGT